jgi:hypothetical protein
VAELQAWDRALKEMVMNSQFAHREYVPAKKIEQEQEKA